jgi:predicted O-linked N-acetylglucosamine transferase (SPINDLY family)
LIRQDEVDILVDLKGYTRDGRLPILAHRPAPVQVHHVGFPGTLGADFVDYLVADRFVAPPEHPEFFSEKIAYLPDCYQPTDDTRKIGERPSRQKSGLPEEGVVFCSFNQSYKIIPEVFERWCQLLQQTPDSVLWLLAWSPIASENLRKRAEEFGVDPKRLVFAPSMRQTDHLGRLQNFRWSRCRAKRSCRVWLAAS